MEPTRPPEFFRRWFLNTLGVMAAAHIVAGVGYDHWSGLIVASLLLGILNAFLRPVLILLTLPLVILSLGLFTLCINALLVYAIAHLVTSFHVAGYWPAFKASLVISIVSLLANWLLGPPPTRQPRPPSPPSPPNDPGGPIIDV